MRLVEWIILPLLLLLIVNCSCGTLESSYEEGTNYVNSLQDQAKANLSTINKSEIPGFTTDDPPEAALYDNAKHIDDQARQSLQTSEAGQTITETAKTRQRFTIDPNTDPLFKAAQAQSIEEYLRNKDFEKLGRLLWCISVESREKHAQIQAKNDWENGDLDD